MHSCFSEIESELRRFPEVKGAIDAEVMDMLESRHAKVEKLLTSYVKVNTSLIQTTREDFNVNMTRLLLQSNAMPPTPSTKVKIEISHRS